MIKLNSNWEESLINKEYWTIYPPYYPFRDSYRYIDLDDRLVFTKCVMNFAGKNDLIDKTDKELYDIIMNTKRWKFICYKVQNYYKEPIHDIDTKYHILKSIESKLSTMVDCCKSTDTYNKAVELRYMIAELIQVYASMSFNLNELFDSIETSNDNSLIKRLAKIFRLARNVKGFHILTKEFINNVLYDTTKRMYYKEINKVELPENILEEV